MHVPLSVILIIIIGIAIISYHIGWVRGFKSSSDICDRYHGYKRQ